MARVQSAGATARILQLPEGAEGDKDIVNVAMRFFVVLEDGTRVVDEASSTTTIGTGADRLHQLQDIAVIGLRYGQLPSDHRKAQWGRLIEQLAALGIATDAETLMSLPFVVEPDEELRARMGSE